MEIKIGGKFINFGCYDGITNDPIYEYIREYNLSGYFVDANINKLITCKNNIEGDFIFEGLGINTSSGEHIFYEPKELKNVPEWFYQTGTFELDKVFEICNKLNISLDSYSQKNITCERIDEFIINRNLFELEIVNIDLEGLDSYVIMQFPFEFVKPKVIIIEIINENGLDEKTFNYIISKGYTSDRNPITDWSVKFTLRE